MKNKGLIIGLAIAVILLTVYLFSYRFPKLKEPEVTLPPVESGLSFLNVSDGFKISVAAKGLENPRVILFDSMNRMLVSETKAGRVSVLEDPEPSPSASYGASKNGEFKIRRVLIENLKSPHGLDFYQDPKTKTVYLYIAETHQVVRYPYDIKTGRLTKVVGEQITKLPADGGHFTRTIAFGPNFRKSQIIGGSSVNTQMETKLYISVGSSCDVCEENTWKRAAILESDPEGSYTAEFAGGLRNSVFFTFHPITKEIWATDMGRDNLGDNLPPDEVNIVRVAGPEDEFGAKRYGWPFCYGDKIKDTKFNPEKFQRLDISSDCSKTESPAIQIPAHSAPLGLAFITSDKWPSQWHNDLLVAYHGSWNRSERTGYKIVRFKVDKNGKISETSDFITGWLSADKKNVYGRPVDLKFGPDGALYISDDVTGVIYMVNLL